MLNTLQTVIRTMMPRRCRHRWKQRQLPGRLSNSAVVNAALALLGVLLPPQFNSREEIQTCLQTQTQTSFAHAFSYTKDEVVGLFDGHAELERIRTAFAEDEKRKQAKAEEDHQRAKSKKNKDCWDNRDFTDPDGFSCDFWRKESCEQGGKWYNYSDAQMAAIRKNCRASCGECGKPCRDNKKFKDAVTQKKCFQFSPEDCDKLEDYAYTGMEAKTLRDNCPKSCAYCERPVVQKAGRLFTHYDDCDFWTPILCYYAHILFPLAQHEIERVCM